MAQCSISFFIEEYYLQAYPVEQALDFFYSVSGKLQELLKSVKHDRKEFYLISKSAPCA